MLYLDYILYITLLILLCILIKKVSNKKEGFDHIGKGFVAKQKDKYKSVIASATYFGKDADTGKVFRKDVKSILDQFIVDGTASIVVFHKTFGVNNAPQLNPSNKAPKLGIQFINEYITTQDGTNWATLTGKDAHKAIWAWNEGDSLTLSFADSGPDTFWLNTIAAIYKLADLFAYIIIRAPYQFLSQLVDMGIKFVQNFQNMFQPLLKFVKQMVAIAKNIFKQIWTMVKNMYKMWMKIMKDIPGFLKSMFDNIIDFVQTAVMKTFDLLKKFFDIATKIFFAIIKLPLTIFDMVDQLGTVFVNLFMIIINIPTAFLNMIIGFQDIMLQIMQQNPKIPFLDMFFG
jgi:phage-related protein